MQSEVPANRTFESMDSIGNPCREWSDAEVRQRFAFDYDFDRMTTTRKSRLLALGRELERRGISPYAVLDEHDVELAEADKQ